MKNVQKKALPDLTKKHRQTIKYLTLVNKDNHRFETYPHELAEDLLFTIDSKIQNYKSFMLEEMREGIKEIVSQEFDRSKKIVSDKLLSQVIENNDYDYDRDENNQYYYTNNSEIDMEDKLSEEIIEHYIALSVEAYRLATDHDDSLFSL